MHFVGTKPAFIQLQSWQMVCHSGPTELDPVWFHYSASIPGSITHPGKRGGYFQRLASWAPRIRRGDRGMADLGNGNGGLAYRCCGVVRLQVDLGGVAWML